MCCKHTVMTSIFHQAQLEKLIFEAIIYSSSIWYKARLKEHPPLGLYHSESPFPCHILPSDSIEINNEQLCISNHFNPLLIYWVHSLGCLIPFITGNFRQNQGVKINQYLSSQETRGAAVTALSWLLRNSDLSLKFKYYSVFNYNSAIFYGKYIFSSSLQLVIGIIFACFIFTYIFSVKSLQDY